MPKVQVKVIGTDNPTFFSGQTDLRGVYVAEGVDGQVTAVARKGAGQYAFYRGTARVGAAAAARRGRRQPRPPAKPDEKPAESQSLDKNLKDAEHEQPDAAARPAPEPLPARPPGRQPVLIGGLRWR